MAADDTLRPSPPPLRLSLRATGGLVAVTSRGSQGSSPQLQPLASALPSSAHCNARRLLRRSDLPGQTLRVCSSRCLNRSSLRCAWSVRSLGPSLRCHLPREGLLLLAEELKFVSPLSPPASFLSIKLTTMKSGLYFSYLSNLLSLRRREGRPGARAAHVFRTTVFPELSARCIESSGIAKA